jgi:Carboxypeptidase regulatory-like domain
MGATMGAVLLRLALRAESLSSRRTGSRPGVRPRVRRIVGLLAGAALLAARGATAHEVSGSIEGRLLDAARAPIAQAHVVATGPALIGTRATVSDEKGRFRLLQLPVGTYQLRISRLGHAALPVADVVVALGMVLDLGDLTLPTEAVEVAAASVTAPRRVRRATAIGGAVSREVFSRLPSDRDYQSIVTLLPHASASYFGDRAGIAGTSGPESNYYVDGSNVVEPPGNGVSTSLPYNLVEAVEVRAGAYDAEFGGAGGGIVNAVTASGGDTFHGQVFGFFANRVLTSTAGYLGVTPKTEEYASWDAGASVGGPLIRERVWYFAAYDPTREREDIRLPGFGVQQDPRWMQRFAAKISARPDDRTRLALSLLGDPMHRDQIGGVALSSTQALGNLDPMLVDIHGGGLSLGLTGSRTLGTTGVLEASASLFDSRYRFIPATARGASEPLYLDARTGYVEGGVGSRTDRDTGRLSARASYKVARGAHLWKVGAGWDDEAVEEHLTLNQVTRIGDSLWQEVTVSDRVSRNHVRAPHAFVQDAWRIGETVRLDAGLRWAAEYWITSGGDVGQRIPSQWQPRLGVAWSTGPDRSVTLSGFAGRFIQRTRLNVPQFFLQDVPSTYLVRIFTHDPRTDPNGGTPVFAQTLGRQAEVDGLRGATFDEGSAGADVLVASSWRMVARGVYRAQREGIVGVISPLSGQAVYGNPGRGELGPYPGIVRRYRALEMSVERQVPAGWTLSASYLLSSLRGNYEGYWDQTAGVNDPLGGGSFIPEPGSVANTEGPLPGDRPHQIKAHASVGLTRAIQVGATLWWASGSPLSELGSTPYGRPYYRFLQPRGSLGRTPSIYDLGVRVSYAPRFGDHRLHGRLLADAYHIGNPRRPVVVDQVHYLGVSPSGQQIAPNPNYGKTLFFQPDAAYRLGLEVTW